MNKKSLIVGFFLGIISRSLVIWVPRLRKLRDVSAHNIETHKIESDVPTYIVSDNDQYLFQYKVVGNGFYLRVDEEDIPIPRMLFSKLFQYSDGMKYSLASSRILDDGRLKEVNYDMDTGEIERIMYWDGNEGEVYDSEGNLVYPDNQLGEVHGEIRRPLETLQQRREELSEKLRNFEPPVDEQN